MTAFELRVIVKALMLPPAAPLLLGLAGLLCLRRRPRVGQALCAVAILSLWVLATPLIADMMARSLETYPPFDPAHLSEEQSRAQAIVVLEGGLRRAAPDMGADAPDGDSAWRLIEGAKVARATQLPVLITGTARGVRAMRRFMEQELQMPVRWVEEASADTHENALFSARMLKQQGIERIILVTSSAHMARSVIEFRSAGLQVCAAPAEMWTLDERGVLSLVPSVSALQRSRTAVYEWGGRLMRGLRYGA